MPVRPSRFAAVPLAMLTLQAACAPMAAPRLAVVPPPPPATGAQGVILAERPVPATGAAMRGILLSRLGAAPAGQGGPALPAGQGGPALVEFVFRDGEGRTLSVVQANPRHLRAGDRVTISWQPRTELLPVATEVAAAPGG